MEVGDGQWRHGTRAPVTSRLLPALLVAVLGVPSFGAAEAQARFVVNRSMDGVALGMSSADARERLGDPAHHHAGPDFTTWHYRRPPIEVTFKPRVVTLHTTSAGIRGPRNIGVGTRERRLKAVIGPALRCQTTARQRLCVVGSFETGRRSTVFEMVRRRVAAVTISRSVE